MLHIALFGLTVDEGRQCEPSSYRVSNHHPALVRYGLMSIQEAHCCIDVVSMHRMDVFWQASRFVRNRESVVDHCNSLAPGTEVLGKVDVIFP